MLLHKSPSKSVQQPSFALFDWEEESESELSELDYQNSLLVLEQHAENTAKTAGKIIPCFQISNPSAADNWQSQDLDKKVPFFAEIFPIIFNNLVFKFGCADIWLIRILKNLQLMPWIRNFTRAQILWRRSRRLVPLLCFSLTKWKWMNE